MVMKQKRKGNEGKPKVGQIILLKDRKKKRNLWKKCKITSLIKSHDKQLEM